MSKIKNFIFSKFSEGVVGLVLLLIIICAINMIISSLRLRTDMTEEKLYTLSKGSKEILKQLDNDVTLKFYFSSSSRDMPMMLKTYAAQVQDLLKEYQLAGKGRVILEAYDTKPDSDAEEWAQRYGIEPQQTSILGQPVYFGLVAVCQDREGVISEFSPSKESTLEYDITRLITHVAWPEKPVIGLMSTLDVLGSSDSPVMQYGMQQKNAWIAFQDLQKDYTVKEIPIDTDKIDDEIKTLIVLHPKNLSDETLFALDQFVMGGGRMIVCVDPFCIADYENSSTPNAIMPMGGGSNPPGPSSLEPLFETWGIGFDSSKIVADMSSATKLTGSGGEVEDNPAFLSLGAENMAQTDILTAQLSQIMLPFAGAIEDNTSEDLNFTPLITTSENDSCLVDAYSARFGSSMMRSQLTPDHMSRALAVRLQGEFKTAFPDGKIGSGTNVVENALESGRSTVMIFSDVDFLKDNFCVQTIHTIFGSIAQPINNNLTLFANAVEQFAGREELIGVRSRGKFHRPFTKVDQLEAKALKQWKEEEDRLQASLQQIQQRLQELQLQKTGDQRLILSEEQQNEIIKARKMQADTRKQLKNVRKKLNRDIENLGRTIKFINIALIPILVIIFGISRGIKRKKTIK